MTAVPEVIEWWRDRVLASHHDPRLAGALLDRRYVRYAIRRLRGFAIVRGGAAMLYVLEVAVLLRVMSVPSAIVALIAAHVGGLLGGFWWGATELQRRAIRETPADADRITATWLWWSCVFGGAAFALAVAAAMIEHERPIVAAYAIVLGLRIAADLPLRVWHSRIAARRRVYRMMWLQLAVEATGPLLVLALSERDAIWGFFVAMAASTIVSRAVTWYFIRRAYRANAWTWIRPARRLEITWSSALGLGVAGVATRIPNLVGVVFLAVPGLPPTVSIGFTMTVGALSGASGWAWAHYVDFLAVRGPLYRSVRARLERMVIGEAIVVGIVAGGLALAIVYVAAPRTLIVDEPGVIALVPPSLPSPWPYALALPALAVGLALLAAGQVIAWMRGVFAVVAASGVAVVLGLPLLGWIGASRSHGYTPASIVRGEHLATGGALALLAIAVWLVARRTREPAPRRVTWDVARMRADAAPSGVYAITVARSGAIVRGFEQALQRSGASWWARRGRAWLVAGLTPSTKRQLALDCAGLVTSIAIYRVAPEPILAPAEGRTYVLRFDRRVAAHRELTEHELQLVWSALKQRLAGGAPMRRVAVSRFVFDGEAVVGLTARFPQKRQPA